MSEPLEDLGIILSSLRDTVTKAAFFWVKKAGQWPPLVSLLRNDFYAKGDLGVDDLDLRVIQGKCGIEVELIFERLSADVKDELTHFFIEIYRGFDAADLVIESD